MKQTVKKYLRVVAALVIALPASAATAAVLTPADIAGGYSGSVTSPTVVGSDYSDVSGTTKGSGTLVFLFSNLAAGGQSITLDFNLNADVMGFSNFWRYYAAGGNIRYSLNSAFEGNSYTGGWDLGSFAVSNSSTKSLTNSVLLTLPSDFSGDLYLALNFTYGNAPVNFDIGSVTRASMPDGSVPAVPLPASLVLLAGAVGALGLHRRKAS